MYPIIYQDNLYSCGPSCIYMLCEYYHINYDKQQILFHTKTTNKGTTIWEMRTALHFLGFTSIAVEIMSFSSYDLKFPIIALLMPIKEVYHYVVVYQKSRTLVIIGDPAKGILKMKISEFVRISTGITIIPKFI